MSDKTKAIEQLSASPYLGRTPDDLDEYLKNPPPEDLKFAMEQIVENRNRKLNKVDPSVRPNRTGKLTNGSFNEDFVKRNIDLESFGLGLVEYEHDTGIGYIDILCRDKDGMLVVVEVKKGLARSITIGQVLGYMSMLDEESRAIIIASGFTSRLIAAAKRVGVDLIEYRVLIALVPCAVNTINR